MESNSSNEYSKLLHKLAIEFINNGKHYCVDFNENSVYAEIKNKTPEERVKIVIELINLIDSIARKDPDWSTQLDYIYSTYKSLLPLLVRRKLKFTDEELIHVMHLYKNKKVYFSSSNFSNWPIGLTVMQYKKHIKANGLSEKMKTSIEEIISWRQFDDVCTYGSDLVKAKHSLEELIIDKNNDKQTLSYEFETCDSFGDFANKEIESLDEDLKNNIYDIFNLAGFCRGSKPTKKYEKQSKEIIEKISPKKYKYIVYRLFEFIIALKEEDADTYKWLSNENANCIKGIIWSLLQFDDTETMTIIVNLAERSFKKIPYVGQFSTGIGNACVYYLSLTKGLAGIGHLSRLKLKIPQERTKQLIENYLKEIAFKRGISSSEIEEMSIPDFNLKNGRCESKFDDYSLVLQVEKVGKTSLQWLKPDKTFQKSVPAFIKNNVAHAEKLKKIKLINKQVQKHITYIRDRIDRFFIENRKWTYDKFEKYYHNHGLVSFISRKLLWVFTTNVEEGAVGMWHQGRWQKINGQNIEGIDDNTTVSLWHPINADMKEIVTWRARFDELEIQQPLKQVYREIYILTDAELNTQSYSNRMASHILKQHQFNALTSVRDWKYSLVGDFDGSTDKASIKLIEWDISAEFWINKIEDNQALSYSGIWFYIVTDQVRFINKEGETIDLIDVPKIVFSEIMRDVDLFVGVCSVGNDPNWRNSGEMHHYHDYWENYSFGNLTEIAKTRKTVLERLLPRLKIKDVATIDGKFLIVKGKIRTYKIHIGSSNILMEPNDQYLCIVSDRRSDIKTKKVFLPFEGDKAMSVVLSKAFLLADDDKITDSTIISQIRG